jgi:hypothetical protein
VHPNGGYHYYYSIQGAGQDSYCNQQHYGTDKKRNEDVSRWRSNRRSAGVDDTQHGYLEEAFDQDYEQENDYGVNLQGRFNNIDEDEHANLLDDLRDMDESPYSSSPYPYGENQPRTSIRDQLQQK